MAKRTHKNCKHLFDLLEAADLPALHILGEAKPFDFLATLDATLDGPAFREAAGIVLGELPREAVVKADQEAVRILPLADWRGEELLNFAESTWVFRKPPARPSTPRFSPASSSAFWHEERRWRPRTNGNNRFWPGKLAG